MRLKTNFRSDGWPLCPKCDVDELMSHELRPSVLDELRCLSCGWKGYVLPKKSWATTRMENGEIHVHPLGDIDIHVLTGRGCQCGPKILDDVIISHEAFDGRQWEERATDILKNPEKYLPKT